MVKKYTSKYSGAQIDEAVKAIIENVVTLEDLDPALIEEIKKWIADAKEVLFIPREEFPSEGSDTYLYLATDESILYYWNGEEYKAVTSTDYYTKEEVDKLLEAIENSMPVNTNTTYTIEVDGETITLVSKELNEEEWKDVKVINLKDMFDPLYDTKDAAENALADAKQYADEQIVEANKYTDEQIEAAAQELSDVVVENLAAANTYTDEQIAAEIERANATYETLENAVVTSQAIAELRLAVDSLSGISNAFIFKGEVDSTEDLPTASAENTGHVYIVSKKEYVSDGSKWIELGDEGAYVLKSVYDAHLTTQLEIDKAQNEAIAKKVESIEGKGLSTNDFTDELLEKLEGLENYDDTALNKTLEDLQKSVDNKVEKVEGKGLSANDFTDVLLEKLNGLENYDDKDIQEALDNKVEKIEGKGLSTNDFTNTLLEKLNSLENYDDTSIQATISSLSGDVANKVDAENGKGLSTNDFTNALLEKLNGLENYDDTAIKESIPTKISELTNDEEYIKSSQLDIDSLVTTDDLEDYATLEDISDINLTYTNSTPTELPLGGIEEGETFDNVSIQDMLTRILYPYIEMTVGSVTCSGATPGSFYVHNLPILKSVAINVTKNHAKNLSFKLMSGATQYGNTLTENDIVNGKLTFTNLGTYTDSNNTTQDGLVIDVTKTFTIEYSYTSKSSNKSSSKTVGTFTISFQNPTMSNLSSNPSATSYKVGQTIDVKQISASLLSKGSTDATDGIQSVVLYKDDVEVSSITPTGTSYSFTLSDSITANTTYKVVVNYKSRTGDSTTIQPASIDKSLSFTFTYENPQISMSNTGTTYYSALSGLDLSKITANVIKNSANISGVEFFNNGTSLGTESPDSLSNDTYNPSAIPVDFTCNIEKSYKDYNFTAKAYYKNNSNQTATSGSEKYTLYYPHCWGFVHGDTTLASVKKATLQEIAAQNESRYAVSTIVLDEPSEQKKLLYMTPTGNYSKITDESTGFEETSGYEIGTKEITFDNGVTKTYYVYIWKSKSQSAVNSSFK